MSHKLFRHSILSDALLSDARVWDFLKQVDATEAQRCREAGCPRCGGALHSATYLRRRKGHITLTVEHRAAPGLNDVEIELADDGKGPALRLRRPVPDQALPEPHTAEQRIVKVLADADMPLSQAQIRKRVAARNATVSATLQELIREGRVERASKACYRLTATAVHNAATPQAVIGANGQHEAFPESFRG